jgi:Core-2/I-Branching enzyme
MHLAYVISAYRYPEQLVRVVRRLATPHASFFIHVDRRAPDALYRAMVNGLVDVERVEFLERHGSEWGGFGHVLASLKGLRAAIGAEPLFDRAVLLTGQDYPIKPNEMIAAFFGAHPEAEFLEFFPLPSPEWQGGGLDRVEAWHWQARRRRISIRPPAWLPFWRRRLPEGLRPFGGSSYWCLTRACVSHVLEYVAAHRSIIRFFRRVNVPDELFFQTLVLNSAFAAKVVNDNLRYIRWDPPDAASPAILRFSDLGALATSPALFARKFDATVDADILDEIDRSLLDRPDRDANPTGGARLAPGEVRSVTGNGIHVPPGSLATEPRT